MTNEIIAEIDKKIALAESNIKGFYRVDENREKLKKLISIKDAILLREELEKLGYPHNFQHENSWVVDYCYEVSRLIKKYIYPPNRPKNDSPTTSQTEPKIVKGCISLMHELFGMFMEYLEWRGIEIPKDKEDEEYPCFNFSYFSIVKRLFLWNTSHSGGTSTRKKCDELGFDSSNTVSFCPKSEEE